jgi:hypothetical protein
MYTWQHTSVFEVLKAPGSSKMLIHFATLCILEDGTFISHCHKNLKFYILFHKLVNHIYNEPKNENNLEVPGFCSHLWN